MTAAEKEFYTVKEFARILDVSTDRVYEWARRGNIGATKVTTYSAWRIPVREVERLRDKSPQTIEKKQDVRQLERDSEQLPNWIDVYETLNGKLPPLPEALCPLATNYSPGEPISKEIELIMPGVQAWQWLASSQREQLLQLVEWLGQDPRDYEERIRNQAPPRPGHFRLHPKRHHNL